MQRYTFEGGASAVGMAQSLGASLWTDNVSFGHEPLDPSIGGDARQRTPRMLLHELIMRTGEFSILSREGMGKWKLSDHMPVPLLEASH